MNKKTTKPETAMAKSDIVSSLTATQAAAYEVFANEWGRRGPQTPEIKISYEKGSESQFILKHGDETRILGPIVQGVLLKVRNQYTLWNDDKDEAMRTNEFDNFDSTVDLIKGGNVIKSGSFKEIKTIIKADYPAMKYINVMYFFFEEKLYKIYVRPSSRQNLWDYQSETAGRAPFSFITELATTEGKKGTTVFYPITFKKLTDTDPQDFQKYFKLRCELDQALKQMDIPVYKPAEETTTDDDITEIFNA